ncbi:MAG: sugar-binding transcriptional regulator [Trueperaceae bacterium]|nr:MAG: sugar-binding transcriptional regulator [Trueperaceae bacterium]
MSRHASDGLPDDANARADQDDDLMIEAATLYYEEQLTQAEIGQRLATSRSTVSRLLRDARARGVVQFTIHHPWARHSRLEARLRATFGLRDARVLRAGQRSPEAVLDGVGALAARYLQGVIRDGMVLGVSYGRTIAATIGHLTPTRPLDLVVVQLLGALGSDNPLIEGSNLARDLAAKYGATYRYLYAPLVVEDARTRDRFVQEPLVQDVLAVGRQADIALVGIGVLGDEAPSLIYRGYLGVADIARLRALGAVGNMCAQFFDADGVQLDTDLNQRAISIGLDGLKGIGLVVAAASGRQKAPAILGALRGGHVDVLISDDEAIEAVLACGAS